MKGSFALVNVENTKKCYAKGRATLSIAPGFAKRENWIDDEEGEVIETTNGSLISKLIKSAKGEGK